MLIGAGFAYLQFTEQQQSSRDLLISNQVSKGFELLGNKEKELEQRLGGIYALEGVMNDLTSPQYRQPILEALSAFVRGETKSKTDEPEPPAIDVQAVLTVIGRRAKTVYQVSQRRRFERCRSNRRERPHPRTAGDLQ